MANKEFLAVLSKVREPEGSASPSMDTSVPAGGRSEFRSLLQKVRDPNFQVPIPPAPAEPAAEPSIFDRVKGVGQEYAADLKTIASALPFQDMAGRAVDLVRGAVPDVVPSVPVNPLDAIKTAAGPLAAPGREIAGRMEQMGKAEGPLKEDAAIVRNFIADYISGDRGVEGKVRGGSREEIFARAEKTGKISMKDILNRTLGEMIAENIPLTPTEIGIAAMAPRAINFAGGTLLEAFPALAKPVGEIGKVLKEFVTTKKIEVPISSQQIKDFYVFGRERLDPKTYDMLVKMDPDALKAMAKAGKGGAVEARVPRFGAQPEAPAPRAPGASASAGGPMAPVSQPSRAQFADDLGRIRTSAEAPAQSAAPTRAGFMGDLGKVRTGEMPVGTPSSMGSKAGVPAQPVVSQAVPPEATTTPPTGQTPPVQPGTSAGTAPLRETVFPAPKAPYASSVTRHPDFVNLTNDTTAVVEKYAKERGVEPTYEFAVELWDEMHDVVGKARLLPLPERIEAMKALAKKYPDFDAEFIALTKKLTMDKSFGDEQIMRAAFDIAVAGKYGHIRPKVATAREMGAKEPWQMTRNEFSTVFPNVLKKELTPAQARAAEELYARETGDRPEMAFSMSDWQLDTTTGKVRPSQMHKPLVAEAISEGKPVPPEVLAEYPDLAKKRAPGSGKQSLRAPEEPAADIEALSSKSWQVEMPKEQAGKGTINKLQIMDFAEKAFDVPIRSKLTHRMIKEAGHFEVYQRLIRLKKWGELEVLMHEVGHAQDQALQKLFGKKWKYELLPEGVRKAAYTELRKLDYDQGQQRASEGFAEYMRYWMTTERAAQVAPTFHKAFQEALAKNPSMKAKMEEMKALYTRYLNQGAENRILSQIDFKGEIQHRVPVKEKVARAMDWFKNNWVDELWTIKKIEGELGKESRKNVAPTKSAFEMATFVKQKASGIARTFVEQGAVDEFGNIVGPSLEEILKPIPRAQMKTFIAYGAAKRALLLAKRGLESGFDIEDARFIVDKYKSEAWDKAVDGLTEWSDHGMEWLVRAGALSEAERQIIKQLNPIYLPFKRIFVDEVEVGGGSGGAFAGGSPIKKIHGSGRPIKNPLEALVSQMTEMISRAHKMRVASLIAEWTKHPAAGKHIAEIPAPMKVTTLSMDQVADHLRAMGVDLADVDLDKVMTVFSQSDRFTGKGNVVSLWRGGKRRFYELSPELYKALQGVDDVHINSWLLKPLILMARLQRLGATGLKASFGLLRNPFRDMMTYALFSKRRNATIFDPLKGVYRDLTAKPGDLAFRFKAAGGELSNPIGYDRAATMAVYDEMLIKKLPHGTKLMVVKHPIDALRRLFQIPEMGPRIAELEGSYKKYREEHPDWSEEDAFVAAFNDAQDVTLNFTRSGRHGKIFNQIAAFFNAQMQGLSKMNRAAKEDPTGFILKGLAWITPLALWTWHKNKDKQWYRNLEPAYKFNNFFFEVGKEIFRLPMPFELGVIFGAMPMAVADSIYRENPKFLKGLYDNLEAGIPSIVPTAFQPAIDVLRNKDFLGRPVESEGMKFLPVEERKRYYTTEISKILSRGLVKFGINLSPVQLDYMIWNYTGGLPGQFKFNIKELSDVPIMGDVMVRTPEKPTRQLNEFFDELTTLTQRKAADKITGKELGRLAYLEAIRKSVYKPYSMQIKMAAEKEDVKKVRELYGEMAEAFEKAGF